MIVYVWPQGKQDGANGEEEKPGDGPEDGEPNGSSTPTNDEPMTYQGCVRQ